jgi:hypothetical protein
MVIKINAFLAILNVSNVVWDNRFLSGGIFDEIL